MEFVELLKYMPEGVSVSAVMIVVIMFLRQQDKFAAVMKSVAIDCHESHKEAREDYQKQVTKLSDEYKMSTEKIADKTVQATKDLENAVRELNHTVLLIGREAVHPK